MLKSKTTGNLDISRGERIGLSIPGYLSDIPQQPLIMLINKPYCTFI